MINYSSADLSLQKAMFSRLNGKVLYARVAVPVYDTLPENKPLPYIVIGEMTGYGDNVKDNGGEVITITLHIWSERPSMVEVKSIRATVEGLLTQSKLELDEETRKAWHCEVVYRDAFTDADGLKKHGVLKIEYRVCEVTL